MGNYNLKWPTENTFKRVLSKRKEDYEMDIYYDETINKLKNDKNKDEGRDH